MTVPPQSMFTEAIAAARAGDRTRARELFSRLVRSDSANAEYWIWLSSVVDTNRERIFCLESALKLDPTNRAALRGLVILGARKPEGKEAQQVARVPRKMASAQAPARRGSGRRPAIPWRFLGAVGVGAILIVLVGIIAVPLASLLRPRAYAPASTLPPLSPTASKTTQFGSPTWTPIPPSTRVNRTAIPTELAGTPLAFLVDITPIPTPVFGATPRPDSPAYQAGLTAVIAGNYEASQGYMEAVIEAHPDWPDAHYFLGESKRRQGDLVGAIRAFDRAILLAHYAPAYLGRALTMLEFRPDRPPVDFDEAIDADPLLTEAYLAKAEYLAEKRLWKTIEETLQSAIDAGAGTPLVYVRMSEAQVNRERLQQALDSAIEGSGADPTLLEGYLAVGRAYTELEQYGAAQWPLETFVAYDQEDPRGWAYLARTLAGNGQPEQAIEMANRSLELKERFALAYLARANAYLVLGEGEKALDDLLSARRFGVETYANHIALGEAYYLIGDSQQALEFLNLSISETLVERRVADGYVLRALVYESLDPPQTQDAIINWRWILDLKGSSPEARAIAEEHLFQLTGVRPTPAAPAASTAPPALTPTPSRTPTPTPLGGTTSTSSRTPTATRTPTRTPTPSRTPTTTPS
ncbi:MAG: tetratricopeptide repeat protein [Anaerolineales bacterium]|nr:tetratricopeptide repeat protein [Anaerolineales bacterium]